MRLEGSLGSRWQKVSIGKGIKKNKKGLLFLKILPWQQFVQLPKVCWARGGLDLARSFKIGNVRSTIFHNWDSTHGHVVSWFGVGRLMANVFFLKKHSIWLQL